MCFFFSPQQPCIAATPHLRCHTSFVLRLTLDVYSVFESTVSSRAFAEGHWRKCYKLLWSFLSIFPHIISMYFSALQIRYDHSFILCTEPKLSLYEVLLQYRCSFDTIIFFTSVYCKKNITQLPCTSEKKLCRRDLKESLILESKVYHMFWDCVKANADGCWPAFKFSLCTHALRMVHWWLLLLTYF